MGRSRRAGAAAVQPTAVQTSAEAPPPDVFSKAGLALPHAVLDVNDAHPVSSMGEVVSDHGPIENHPESPNRISACLKRLRNHQRLWRSLKKMPRRRASDAELQLCHDASHVTGLRKLAELAAADDKPRFVPRSGPVCMGGPCCDVREGSQDGDTFVTAGSLETARLSVGGVLQLVDEVMRDGGLSTGFALCRPPGHHASSSRSSGFCLLNNVAVAAAYALENYADVNRVLIFDWDVHHGQGTQQIFEQSRDVLVVNAHRHDGHSFYPASGSSGEVGHESGRGYTINVALPEGYGGAALWNACAKVLVPAMRTFRPNLVLVSAGFDSAAGDPLGGCSVTPQEFGALTTELRRLAAEVAEGRIVFVLEGGYDPEILADCVEEVISALTADEIHDDSQKEPFANPPEWLHGDACNGCVRRTCEAHHALALRLPLPCSKSERKRIASEQKAKAKASAEIGRTIADVLVAEDVASSIGAEDVSLSPSPRDVDVGRRKVGDIDASIEVRIDVLVVKLSPMRCPQEVVASKDEIRVWHAPLGGESSMLHRWRLEGVHADNSGALRCAEFRPKKRELTIRLNLGLILGGAVRLVEVTD
eukprot:TRINITY_DN29318_c0_g1_i1.p1 TRINITY_DN29318_c0_g1~~TRINITY_DN29318_c0_g1_i1.p1  ORF type:complete len:591 (-),score=73.67 TRINITY_DN29318_c0_g1_i1:212-1984(-)